MKQRTLREHTPGRRKKIIDTRMRLVGCLFLCLTLILFSFPFSCSADALAPLTVYVNGLEVAFDARPFLEKGRLMVPLRAIMEHLDAAVHWDSRIRSVTVRKGERTLILVVGSNIALVDNRPATLDVAPRIVERRTFLPLRFLSENLGYTVYWDGPSAAVYIYTGLTPAKNPSRVSAAPVLPQKTGEIRSISLGASAGEVTALLGAPQRVDPSPYGLQWWIYNDDLLHYMQVGMRNQRVAAIYTNGRAWRFGGVAAGDGQQELASAFNLEKTVQIAYDGAIFTIFQTDDDLAERPLVVGDGYAAVFYRDIQEGGRVVALLLADFETILKRGGLNWHCRFDPRYPPDISGPALSASEKEKIEAASALQLLDLANSVRLRRGLPLLSWHEGAAAVARLHSREMYVFNYFSHNSPVTGRGPAERLAAAGIAFLVAGENLAYGLPDSFSAHEGLMNSPGHRVNILRKDFTHMGAGVVEEYYTQKFLTPWTARW